MRQTFTLLAILWVVGALPASAADKQGCSLGKFGELPVTMSGTQPLITGSINGTEAHFLADSGAFYNLLSQASAERFQLKTAPLPGVRVSGVGGSVGARRTTVERFSLAGLANDQAARVEFFVADSYDGYGVDGIIGQNVIGQADSEYDLANGVIRLFRSKNCGTLPLTYWDKSGTYGVVEIEKATGQSPHFVGMALLNGKKIRVMFDSGAALSLLDTQVAARAGVTPDSEGAVHGGYIVGIGRKITPTWLARFDSLDLGGEVIKNARIRFGDASLDSSADMLLGADFFLSHRIYFAKSQQKIYFTHNGGRVFDLRVVDELQAAVSGTKLDENAPTDSGGFRRRGAAFMARQDYAAALADFDRAIQLSPQDAENFRQRALAHLGREKSELALADYDRAIELNPDNVTLRIERGSERLKSKDVVGSGVDFDAVLKLAPDDAGLGYRIAFLHDNSHNYEQSVKYYSLWIAAHPDNKKMSVALNNRCWARAMLRKELDLALIDCDASIKLARTAGNLDSRGMIQLQMGNLERSIADYQSALKRQPKQPWSLYGLGIAETRSGARVQGTKHLEAAIAIDSKVAKGFKKLGLEP